MKEITAGAGERIDRACALVAEAPAWTEFNGVRIEARPGDSAGDLQARWSAEMERKAAEWHASPEYKKLKIADLERKIAEAERAEEVSRKIEASGVRERFPWTEEMGEISGFGGGYEQACRDMVYAGLAWLEEKPRDLANDCSRDLEDELIDASPGCSGAMHGAAMNVVAFVAKHGWPEYVRRMTKRTASDAQGGEGLVKP